MKAKASTVPSLPFCEKRRRKGRWFREDIELSGSG
jgi:hypothetical protein